MIEFHSDSAFDSDLETAAEHAACGPHDVQSVETRFYEKLNELFGTNTTDMSRHLGLASAAQVRLTMLLNDLGLRRV
jgi:hypothetical protein